MLHNIICIKCLKSLDEQGGLIFGPPDFASKSSKFHVCVNCHTKLLKWLGKRDD